MRPFALLAAAAALAAPLGLAPPAQAQGTTVHHAWDSVPHDLRWCRLTVLGVVQDNAGQPLRLRIRNDSGQRVRYTIAIRTPRVGNIGPQMGSAHVDNANPREISVSTSSAFQGNLQGRTVRLALQSCELRH